MLSLNLREDALEMATLQFQSRRVQRISHVMPKVIDITGSIGSDRERVETFITTIFHDTYAANIHVHYPYLISVSNQDGTILAAAGFRYADQQPLFLEQYTAAPIEQELTCLYAQVVQRREIVEIGALASSGNGSSVFLFAALASYLDVKGIRYTVVTSTSNLQRHLRVLGLQPQIVCTAHCEHLHSPDDDWGSYYDTQPRVLVGSVQQGVQSLQQTLGSIYEH